MEMLRSQRLRVNGCGLVQSDLANLLLQLCPQMQVLEVSFTGHLGTTANLFMLLSENGVLRFVEQVVGLQFFHFYLTPYGNSH